jgi:hypothetical protein
MRILNREEFLKQPEGVLFAKYKSTGQFDTLCVKHDTMFGFDGRAIDFRYQDGMEILADDTGEYLEVMKNAEKGAPFSLDLNCGSRDGLFDADQLFVVFEQADLEAYCTLIQSCVPACIDSVEATPETKNLTETK